WTRPATPECYLLSLHDALPISRRSLDLDRRIVGQTPGDGAVILVFLKGNDGIPTLAAAGAHLRGEVGKVVACAIDRKNFLPRPEDRKSTRLNSSHVKISYAVHC